MKRVLALLLCLLTMLGLCACKKNQQQPLPQPETLVSSTTTITATEATEPEEIAYAHNEVINRFFVNFVEVHQKANMDVTTIRRGKDLSEYTAVINECNVTVTDVSNKEYPSGIRYALQIEIVGGTTDKSLGKLLDAFTNITVAADRSCLKSTATEVAEQLEGMKSPLTEEKRVSMHVRVAYYTPVVSNEYATQPCRISLFVTDEQLIESQTTTTTAAQ